MVTVVPPKRDPETGVTPAATVAGGAALWLSNNIGMVTAPVAVTINGSGLFSQNDGALRNVAGVNTNSGVVTPGSGTLNIASAWANSGIVQLSGITSNLAGGTVTACPSASWWWTCASATIAWNGSYWIGSLPSGTYVVSITPPTSSFLSGWYSNWTSGNFTTSASSAPVTVQSTSWT